MGNESSGGRFRKKRVNFSMVSNELIQNKNVSFKAKGLYCMIQYYVTIPDFTLYKSFLMHNCKEGEKAFEAAWKELKDSGYLVQYKSKDEKGKFIYEYDLLDELPESSPYPQNRDMDNSLNVHTPKKEGVDLRHVENPGVDNPGVENGGCINNTIPNNTLPNNNHIISFSDVIEQIGYEGSEDRLNDIIKNIVMIMIEVFNTPDNELLRINKQNMPAYKVKERFKLVGYPEIDGITLALSQYTGEIGSLRNFMLTTIYNAPSTSHIYFQTKVNHDMHNFY